MGLPLVSVIIPAYNGVAYIAQAINSVLAQSDADWELIVVDDGSTDGTGDVVRSYGDRVRYVVQENQDVAAARNRGLREARGGGGLHFWIRMIFSCRGSWRFRWRRRWVIRGWRSCMGVGRLSMWVVG